MLNPTQSEMNCKTQDGLAQTDSHSELDWSYYLCLYLQWTVFRCVDCYDRVEFYKISWSVNFFTFLKTFYFSSHPSGSENHDMHDMHFPWIFLYIPPITYQLGSVSSILSHFPSTKGPNLSPEDRLGRSWWTAWPPRPTSAATEAACTANSQLAQLRTESRGRSRRFSKRDDPTYKTQYTKNFLEQLICAESARE